VSLPSFVLAGVCVYWAVLLAGVVSVLHFLGLQTAGLLAILASVGFGFGLAMQGALSDAAAGVMLSMNNTFSVGDLIQVGDLVGTVRRFSVFTTTLADNNSKHLVTVANRKLYGDVIHNHTSQPTRSVLIAFDIPSNDADMGPVLRDVEANVARYPRVLRSPPVIASVNVVSNKGLTINVRAGIHSADFPVTNNFDYGDALATVVRDTLRSHGIDLVPGTRFIQQ
jgi:small conductance mechanosensitive channel